MAFVVTDNCIQCKYTDCVAVCPMDCFKEGPNFLVIDPDECIDCSMCVPECPVGAIFAEHEVPSSKTHFIVLNRELARDPAWKRIFAVRSPLAEHQRWAKVQDKLKLLRRSWDALGD